MKLIWRVLLPFPLVLTACGAAPHWISLSAEQEGETATAAPTLAVTTTPSVSTTTAAATTPVPTTTAVTTAGVTTTTVAPIALAEAVAPPQPEDFRLVTTGPAEIVFDWSSERCADYDIPDLPARAFRDASGNVQLIAAHMETRRAIGPTLDTVQRDCAIINNSGHSSDPAQFDDNTWLSSPYTTDGQTIYAVMHQEFHGWEHGLTCPGENFACWYNTLTMSISTDAGATYRPLAAPPTNLVAGLPEVYTPGDGPYGVLEPSNIIEHNGAFYMFVRIDEARSDLQRICLMRTFDLADPTGWRYWDGTGFTIANVNPYIDPAAASASPLCAQMDLDIGMMNSSVTWNTELNTYVMVGITADSPDGREVWGVYYSMSSDLIEWTPRQLLAEVELPWTYAAGDRNHFLYASLLDPDSDSRNFDTSDDQAFLYLTRFNESHWLDRDLIRIPVQFFDNPTAAVAATVPFVGRDLA